MPIQTLAATLTRIGLQCAARSKTLRSENFWRLSADPIGIQSLSVAEQAELLAARELNRTHYMPFCSLCGHEARFEPNLRVWAHTHEELADHVCEQVSHPDSHSDAPKGLRMVVWSGETVVLWTLNDGTVAIPDLTEAPALAIKHQRQALAALASTTAGSA